MSTLSLAPAPADQADLVSQYDSLAAALINVHAHKSHQALHDYLATKKLVLASSGTSGSSLLSAGQAQSLGMTSMTALNPVTSPAQLASQLAAQGQGLTSSSYADLDTLAASVMANPGNLDAQVTLAGAAWASQLAAVNTPAMPGVKTPKMPGVPAGALPYGLLLDKALTQVMTDNTALFASTSRSGLGSAKAKAAWNKALTSAWAGAGKSISSGLLDPCSASMVETMATGKAATTAVGKGCSSSCLVGGLYLHQQAGSLLNPTSGSSLTNPTASATGSALTNAPNWVRNSAVASSPSLTTGTLTSVLNGAGSCSAASGAAQSTAHRVLPGVFGSLTTLGK